ncbi:hypothetical protein HMPREF9154_0360 [Arachnia propionica F0230a]|nr:hypothetical protein HMPREF9154_0360 [Arachnia propionica F0230a]
MRDAMVNYRPEPLTGGGDTRKYRVVSTRVAPSSQPGSTSFEETVSFVATPKPGGPAKQGEGAVREPVGGEC